MDINIIKERIGQILKNHQIKDVIQYNGFYYQKALDVWKDFNDFPISKVEIDKIIDDYASFEEGFKSFVDSQIDNKTKQILTLIGTLISYLDKHAANRREWNEYKDKRCIARSGVRQNIWVNNFLDLKKQTYSIKDISAQSVRQSIIYLLNPEENLSVLSKNHRHLIAKYFEVEDNPYFDAKIISLFIDILNDYSVDISDPRNIGLLVTQIIYKLKDLWCIQSKKTEGNHQIGFEPKNIILYGAPGVGKTFIHKQLIKSIDQTDVFSALSNLDKGNFPENDFQESLEEEFGNRYEFICFHQSYSYEDFIRGFRPIASYDKSNLKIDLQDGIFKQICDNAKDDPDRKYYLVIDEINRGNISKIFGELITLLEEDKRVGASNQIFANLPYSEGRESFGVPSNLYIIGTMNTADKSIANIDIALRRRFTFVRIETNPDLIENGDIEFLDEFRPLLQNEKPTDLRTWFIGLNKFVEEEKGKDYQIGHSYFMDIKTNEYLQFILRYKIAPLMEEYFFYENSDTLKNIMSYMEIQLIDKDEDIKPTSHISEDSEPN